MVLIKLSVQGHLAEVRTKAGLPERRNTAGTKDTTQGTRDIIGFFLLPALTSSVTASYWPNPARSLKNTVCQGQSLPVQIRAEEDKKWMRGRGPGLAHEVLKAE